MNWWKPSILKAKARSRERKSPEYVKMVQERFDLTINLIRNRAKCFSFLPDLLRLGHSTVLAFSLFNNPSRGNTRQKVLAAYELRAELLTDACCIAGYAVLLDGLRKAKHTHICISVFTTEAGTFTVFSDFSREDLIGALYKPE